MSCPRLESKVLTKTTQCWSYNTSAERGLFHVFDGLKGVSLFMNYYSYVIITHTDKFVTEKDPIYHKNDTTGELKKLG